MHVIIVVKGGYGMKGNVPQATECDHDEHIFKGEILLDAGVYVFDHVNEKEYIEHP
ncbi:MAG: hypothetical protein ACOX3Q_05825 [Clostridia bacterium]